MAVAGTIVVNAELHGSAVRLRALELAINTMADLAPATDYTILARAKAFEQYITGA